MGLKLTFKINTTTTDFLDVKLELEADIFKPFMKPNYNPLYIDTRSNHPPHIFRNLPADIAHRIVTNSSSEEIFKNAEPPYKEALKGSGFNDKLCRGGLEI